TDEALEVRAVAINHAGQAGALCERRPHHVPVIAAAKMFLEEFLVNALTRIVPWRTGIIDAVDEDDGEIAVRGDRAHVVREPPVNFVADERIALLVEAGAQDELIEALHAGQRKER